MRLHRALGDSTAHRDTAIRLAFDEERGDLALPRAERVRARVAFDVPGDFSAPASCEREVVFRSLRSADPHETEGDFSAPGAQADG